MWLTRAAVPFQITLRVDSTLHGIQIAAEHYLISSRIRMSSSTSDCVGIDVGGVQEVKMESQKSTLSLTSQNWHCVSRALKSRGVAVKCHHLLHSIKTTLQISQKSLHMTQLKRRQKYWHSFLQRTSSWPIKCKRLQTLCVSQGAALLCAAEGECPVTVGSNVRLQRPAGQCCGCHTQHASLRTASCGERLFW